MARQPISKEEKIAMKIGDLIDHLTLDLDLIGLCIARDNNITYNRFRVIAEAAEYEKEIQSGKQFNTLF